ncbi:MAG: hypothetical protein J6J16_00080 [Lachnospiraceae bacterium]|nr:hypothetical protein [Lachnospiraceae bacterium]
MSMYEYDKKLHIKTIIDIGREESRLGNMCETVVVLKSMRCDNETIIQK